MTIRLLACAALAMGIFVPWFSLADHPLYAPDEGRYARTTQEMMRRGDWLVPYYEGKPRLQKPPVIHWLQGASMTLLGESEFSARLPSTLFTSLTILLTFGFAAAVRDRAFGLIAAVLLANLPLIMVVGRLSIIDPTLNFFWNLAVFAGYLAGRDDRLGGGSGRWAWLFWLAVSAATFTKGPVGLLPALILASWALLGRRWIMPPRRWAAGLALAAAPLLLWVAAVVVTHPDLDVWSLWHREIVERATGAGDHPKGWWWYLPLFIVGFFPATAMLPLIGVHFAPARVRRAIADHSLNAYLAVACLVPFVVFSAMVGKLATYILPLAPATALIAAAGLRRWIAFDRPTAELRARPDRPVADLPDGIGSIASALTIGALGLLALTLSPALEQFFRISPSIHPTIVRIVTPLMLVPALMWSGYVIWRRGRRRAALILMAMTMSGMWLWCLERGEDELTSPSSNRRLLGAIRQLTADGDPPHLTTWDYRDSTLLFYTDGGIEKVETMLQQGRPFAPAGKRWIILSTPGDWKSMEQTHPAIASRMSRILEWQRPRDVVWVMAERIDEPQPAESEADRQ